LFLFKDVFGSFFAQPIAQVFFSLKPRDCGFESRRRLFILLISLFLKIQLNSC